MAGARRQLPSWEGSGVGSGEQFANLDSSLNLSGAMGEDCLGKPDA